MPIDPSKPDPPRRRSEPSSWALMGAGLEMAAVVTVLALAGTWLDKKIGTGPWLVVTGLAIGIIGETYKLWRIGKRFFE